MRDAGHVQFVELAPQMRPAGSQRQWAIGTPGIGDTVVGSPSIDLEQSGVAGEMALYVLAAAAVLEPIGHHRRRLSAEESIVARLGPQPGRLRLARSRRQGRQRRLVGIDPLALLDQLQDTFGERREMEAD